jgi:hypothetical protein
MQGTRFWGLNGFVQVFVISIFPLVTLLSFFPMAGMTNNGNCDSWYYWGMGRSSEIASSTLGIGYYPGSRVLMYAPGWLIPQSLNFVFWSKLFAIIPILFFVIFLYCRFRKDQSQSLLLTTTFLLLLPITFTQMSANYAITTLLLVLATTITIIFDTRTKSKYLILGFLFFTILLTNPEGVLFVAPMLFVFLIKEIKSFFYIIIYGLIGSVLSTLGVIFVLATQESTRQYIFNFYEPQLRAILDSFRNPSGYFTTVDNLNPFVASPTPLILILSVALSLAIYFKEHAFPKGFDYQILTICSIFIMQLFQIGNPLSESFNSVALVSLLIVPLNHVLVNIVGNKRMIISFLLVQISFFVLSFFLTLFLLSSDLSSLFSIFHIILPTMAILITGFMIKMKFSSIEIFKPFTFMALVVMSSIAVGDYSRPFYQKENVPYFSRSAEYKLEYKIAAAAINLINLYSTSNEYAGIAIENSSNDREVKFARSASRALSSCGHPWSTFTLNTKILDMDTRFWPSNLLIASPASFELSNLPFSQNYKVLKTQFLKLDATEMKLSLLELQVKSY